MMVSPWRKTGTSSPRFSLMNHGSLCSCSGKLTSLSSQTRPFSLMTRRTCDYKHDLVNADHSFIAIMVKSDKKTEMFVYARNTPRLNQILARQKVTATLELILKVIMFVLNSFSWNVCVVWQSKDIREQNPSRTDRIIAGGMKDKPRSTESY